MSSFPLAANQIQQPPNSLDEFARIFQLRGLQQSQQLQQGQQQLQQGQIQEQQLALADDQKWRSAMARPDWDGSPEQLLKNGLKAGVGPQSYAHIAQSLATLGEATAKFGSEQLKTQQALNDHVADQLEAVDNAPDQQKLAAQQQAKANSIAYITSTPGIHPTVRQQMLQGIQRIPDDAYIGDDAIEQLIGQNKLHSAIVEEGLKNAQAGEASQKGRQAGSEADLAAARTPGAQAESVIQQQNAALGTQGRALAGNLPYAAATGVPGAKTALQLETEQKRQSAIAQVQAQAQMYAGNSALAKVPPHLVPAATSEATKLANDYAGAKSASDNMTAFLDLARSGNKAASVNVPLQGALEITTAQGVHRINRTEVEQYGNAGSLFDKISGRIQGVVSGKNIPDDVLADMQQLQNTIAGTAETKYRNGLKAVNQNYGANFTPVQMETAPGANRGGGGGNGPQPGYTRIQASDGSMHDIPSQNMNAAKKRDPGLQVIQ